MHGMIDRVQCAEQLSRQYQLGSIELRNTGLEPEFNVIKNGSLIGTVMVTLQDDDREGYRVHIGEYQPC